MQKGKFNIVTDGCWGSCGKGLITTAIADKYRPEIISTTNMANAGHTAVDNDGKKFVAKAVPSAAVLTKWRDDYQPQIVIGSTAAFTVEQLQTEIQQTGINHSLTIHDRAGVITTEHKQREADLKSGTKHVASTMQGCGAFLADKVMRRPGLKLARDYMELAGYKPDSLPKKLVGPPGEAFNDLSLPIMLDRLMQVYDWTILHEGAQGFSLDINHGSHYPQCYDPQTIVTVRSDENTETLRIIDLVKRKDEFSYIEDGSGWSELKDAWTHDSDNPILAIVCGHNTVPVTSSHPIIIKRNGQEKTVPAAEIKPGDWMYTPIPVNNQSRHKHFSPSMAYAIGYFLGDGWIVGEYRDPPHRPSNVQKKKTETARYARYRNRKRRGLVGTAVGTTISSKTKSSRTTQALYVSYSSENFFYLPAHLTNLKLGITYKEIDSKAYKLHVYNSNWTRQLLALKMSGKLAKDKRLMPDYMSYSDKSVAGVLAGYIDADGCVSKSGRITFGVTSLALCAQWQRWLHTCGIKCLVRPRKKYGDGYSAGTDSNHWRMEIRFHKNHEDHPILVELKRLSAKMHEYIPTQTNWNINNTTRERTAFYNGMSKVTKIVKINGRQVCDVTTSSGTFNANGVLSHNCTSRGTTAIQNMADMGIRPDRLGDIYVVIRPYPIRVGNVIEDGATVGYSGDAYPGQEEITWADVAASCNAPPEVMKGELTTVTKRLRRVFTFSPQQLQEAVTINGATKLALNFANYLDWSCYGCDDYTDLPLKVIDFITKIEDIAQIPVTIVGTGPQNNHVCFID